MKNVGVVLLVVAIICLLFSPAHCCRIEYRIGDRVWNDFDLDGLQDANEPGIENVTVHLRDQDDALLSTKVTDTDGFYVFEGLSEGNYVLEFELLPGFSFSPNDIDNDDTLDSDVINDSGFTDLFYLGSAGDDMTRDAGMYAVPIPGAVWLLGSGILGLLGFRKRGQRRR